MKKEKGGLKPAQRPSPESLLPLLIPGRKTYIELEDMVLPSQKSLLQRVPVTVRETVREVLQEFVFSHRSFLMPTKEFVARYDQRQAWKAREGCTAVVTRPVHSHCNVHRGPTCSSHSSFATRECTPAHSPVPTQDRSCDLGDGAQSPLDTSYTEIHEKRKLIRKQLNARDLATAVQLKKLRGRSPSLVVKLGGNRGGMKENVPVARWKYVNAQDLVEVRRRHLSSQCSQGVFQY